MEKKLKIIVVEDSENDTVLEIRLIEQAGYKVKYVRVETKEDLEAALKADEWDVVLSDFTMPHFSGAEALKVVRSKDDFIPFIFVSGTIGEDRAVRTLKDGASDYILKIDPKRLVSSIERELRDKGLRLQRIRAQDELRESEERYRDLFDSAPVGYHEIDGDGLIVRVNRRELQLFGYELQEMVGKLVWSFVTDPDSVEERLKGKLAGRVPVSVNFDRIYVRKDGTTFPAIIDESYIRDKRGKVAGIRTVVQDVTARKAAEKGLRESEDKFRTLAEQSPNMIFINRAGRVIYANHRCSEVMGYSQEEMCSPDFDFLNLIAPESRGLIKENFRKHLQGQEIPPCEYTMLDKKGNSIQAIYATTIVNFGGEQAIFGTVTDITERKRAEETNRQEAEKYTAMLETTTDGFARLDGAGKFLEINDAFCTTSGYSREELLNLRISDIEAAEKPEETAGRMEKVVKSGFDRFVSQHRKKDGTIIDVEISVTHWQRAGQFLMFSRDITRSKRTDERLRLLAHTITSVTDCVTVTDTEGVIVFVNKAFLKTYGYSESGVIGKHIDFVRSPLNDPALGAAIKSGTLAGGWQGELLNRRKDGTEFPVHLSSSVVRNERGDVIAMVGVARDISERRQAEEELRLFRQLVDHSNDAFEVIEPETGRFLDVNQKACTDLGYTRDELLRMTVFDIDPALDREQFIGATATSGESIPPVVESLHRRKDGSTFPVEVSLSAVKLEHTYFVAITRDITERKALEEQYRRTQRMDMLGTLASGIAHDLNNVLTPITLAIEMLQRKYGSDEKTARLLSTLELMVNRGSGVVKQILALARGAESRLERLDPVNVVEDVRRMMEQTFPKNISHAATVEKGTGLLLGDRTQVYQILVNLCINARDAMQDGGKLSLSARNAAVDEQYAGMTRGAKAGKYILFEVRDTGTGFMKEDMGKSFDPFFTITEAGKGAGLGLAIAHGLVESHGGFIEVDSEVHKGTVFRVYLPAAATGEQIPQPVPEPTPGLGHGELILIADDEMAIREITKSTLEAYGYKVLVASDGSEAVSLYAGQRDEISLVVTDMAMPIMDGSATVSALRKINPEVRVIVATGYMDSSDTLRISGTANAILKKPYSAAGLMRVITEVLSTADSEV